MIFATPLAFVLLLPIAWIVINFLRKKKAGGLRFSSLAAFQTIGKTTRQRIAPFIFWLKILCMILLTVALARPQKEVLKQGIPNEGVAIELVVDVSSSMDISMSFNQSSISRMEVTRKVVEEFVTGSENLEGRSNDLIGLVTFARYADTICPLTLSHDSLQFFIHDLKIESRPNEDGTAFGDALTLAAARLKTAEERYTQDDDKKNSGYEIKSKVVILLTDGSNNCGRHLPLEGAALAKKWGVRVHTIAIIEKPEMKKIQTPEGIVEVEAPLEVQEQILQKIADETGGIYRRATDEKSLREIYKEIDQMEKSEIQTFRYAGYVDTFSHFSWSALSLLVLLAILESSWLRKIQ